MHDQIYPRLMRVRRRQRWQRVLQAAACGLLASSSACVVAGLCRLVAGHPPEALFAFMVLLTGPIVGGVVGGRRGCTWNRAAAAVDRHYDLKDRVATTLQFLRVPDKSLLHDLQVHDTAEHLLRIDPASVAPLRWPAASRYAVSTLMLALALLLWPPHVPLTGMTPELPLNVASADETPEVEAQKPDDCADPKHDGSQQPDAQQPGDQPTPSQDGGEAGEVLASNSELEKEGGDESSAQHGSNGNSPSQTAGSASQPGDSHDSAGQQASQHDGKSPQPDQRDPDAVAEAAGSGTETTRKSSPREPSDAVAELSEETGDPRSGKPDSAIPEQAASIPKTTLAGHSDQRSKPEPKTLDGRSSVNQKLSGEDAEPTKNWGDALIESFEREHARAEREQRDQATPRSDAADGTTEADQFGAPTQLKSQRELHRVSGRIADDSTLESQKSSSLEQAPKARREYRELYHEYKKQSDAVLNSEAMPLGHRQIIRRYFELIRPSDTGESGTGPK